MFYLILACIGVGHIALYHHIPSLLGLIALVCCGFTVVAYLVLQKVTCITAFYKRYMMRVLYGICVVVCSAWLGAHNVSQLLETQLPHTRDKLAAPLEFTIQQITSEDHLSTRIKVRVNQDFNALGNALGDTSDDWVGAGWRNERAVDNSGLAGEYLNLSWYSAPALRTGQIWRAEPILRRPRGLVNPGGFDYGQWLLGQGISATGYLSGEAQLVGTTELTTLQGLRASLRWRIDGANEKKETHLLAALAALGARRFFHALLLGDKSRLSHADWDVLQATGTVHLMAISGLHIGLMAGFGFLVGLFLTRAILYFWVCYNPWIYRFLPSASSLFFAAFYSALAEFSIPTQRALIAVLLVNSALVVGMRLSKGRTFALVCLIVTIVEPLAWLQQGYWLSFGAVACLLICFSGVVGSAAKWRLGISMQVILSVLMCLPLAALGLPASLVSPFANLVAVPLITFFFVPLLFLWIPVSGTLMGEILLAGLTLAFEGLWLLLTQLAKVPEAAFWPVFLSIDLPLHDFLVVIAITGGVAVSWLLPLSLSLRALGFGGLMVLVLGVRPAHPVFELVVLDVGQGLAVALHHPKKTWLYDTGAHFSDRFNIGRHVVVPYLERRGVNDLSLIVSHADNDHKGGALPVLNQFRPTTVIWGESFDGLPEQATACYQGQSWQHGRATYTVLWPPELIRPDSVMKGPNVKGNNRSCVVLIEIDGLRIVLPGDIEKSVEAQLVASGMLPDIDILLAPHHGSKTSSSRAFLEALTPEHVIVSAGFKNRYGHPHPMVMARYHDLNIKVWQTNVQGAIRVVLDASGWKITALREESPKLWY